MVDSSTTPTPSPPALRAGAVLPGRTSAPGRVGPSPPPPLLAAHVLPGECWANCVLALGRRACPARPQTCYPGYSLVCLIAGAYRHREPGGSRRGSHGGAYCLARAAGCGSPGAPSLCPLDPGPWAVTVTRATRWSAGSPARHRAPAASRRGCAGRLAAGPLTPRTDRRERVVGRALVSRALVCSPPLLRQVQHHESRCTRLRLLSIRVRLADGPVRRSGSQDSQRARTGRSTGIHRGRGRGARWTPKGQS